MEIIMPKKTLGPAHRSLMSAANDQYHAVVSMNKHGEISHAQALAQVFLENGEAGSQAQAVQMAAQEVAHVTRITRGEQVNRQAHKLLDTKAQQGQAQGLSRFGGALPQVTA
jgi:hypothetical protein